MKNSRILIFVLALIFTTLSINFFQNDTIGANVQNSDISPFGRVVSQAIAIDGENSIFVAGTIYIDFEHLLMYQFLCVDSYSPGFSKKYNGGSSDGFLIKFNNSGEKIEYATYIGGNGRDIVTSIVVDDDGYVYVAGYTTSNEDSFPIGGNIPGFQKILSDRMAGFIMKIDTNNDEIVYSTYIGGDSADFITSIAVDNDGNLYAGGDTTSKEDSFPIGGNIPGFQPTFIGSHLNGFLIKLNHEGTKLEYSTYLRTGASGGDIEITSIAVDNDGNLYAGGTTASNEDSFPIGGNIPGFENQHKGFYDGFILKLNPTGTNLLYSTFIGGSGFVSVNSIAIDSKGAAYIVGETGEGFRSKSYFFNFPITSDTPGYNTIYHASGTFIIKLNPSGEFFEYASYLSISGKNRGVGIQVTDKGEAIIAVNTYDGNLPVHPRIPGIEKEYKGGQEGYLVQFSANGTLLDFTSFIGGSKDDRINALAIDRNGKVLITGTTLSTESDNFPIGQGIPGYNSQYNLNINESYIISIDMNEKTYHFSSYLSQK